MAEPRVYAEPSDEQLARFVCVSVFGTVRADQVEVAAHLLKIPFARTEWLHRHRQMQEAAWRLEDEVSHG